MIVNSNYLGVVTSRNEGDTVNVLLCSPSNAPTFIDCSDNKVERDTPDWIDDPASHGRKLIAEYEERHGRIDPAKVELHISEDVFSNLILQTKKTGLHAISEICADAMKFCNIDYKVLTHHSFSHYMEIVEK